MSLTRRSFIKKSSYSAAAVTVLGTGVGLAQSLTSGLVSRIKEVVWDIRVEVTKRNSESDANAKNRGEIQWPYNRVPSASVFKADSYDEDQDYKDNTTWFNEPDVAPADNFVVSKRKWFDTDYILVSANATLKPGFPQASNNDAMDVATNWTETGDKWICQFKTYVTYQWD